MKEFMDEFPTILVAEDDPDDRFLIRAAMDASDFSGDLVFVENGEELLDHLLGGEPGGRGLSPCKPSCLVLDLNMPLKDGREALWEIRRHPGFKDLPVVVLTTSSLEADRQYCTELSVSDFMIKPNSFDELLSMIIKIQKIIQNI